MTRVLLLVVFIAAATPAFAQQCLHGPDESAEQKARKRDALSATRTVNNLQANKGSAGPYLAHDQLLTSRFAQGPNGQTETFKRFNFTPGAEILPGWELTLNTTQDGYWFMIKDKTDPCGFAYISNQNGVIYTAEPIR